jgi:hypothetical protein
MFFMFLKLSEDVVRDLVDHLIDELGVNPDGKVVMIEFVRIFRAIHENIPLGGAAELVINNRAIVRQYEEMCSTPVKLQMSESNGILHFETDDNWNKCNCNTDVVCAHGYGLKFIMSLLVVQNRKVGASNFNMEAFMSDGLDLESTASHDTYGTSIPPPPPIMRAFKPGDTKAKFLEKPQGIQVDKNELADLARQMSLAHDKKRVIPYTDKYIPASSEPVTSKYVSDQVSSVLKRSRPNRGFDERSLADSRLSTPNRIRKNESRPRTPIDESISISREFEILKKHLLNSRDIDQAKIELLEAQNEAQLAKMNELVESISSMRTESEVASTIVPRDSVSNAGHHRLKYKNEGSVIMRQPAMTAIDEESGRETIVIKDSMIRGYIRDEDSYTKEQSIVDKITDINGLTAPFKSDRLNFYANFHTGMDNALNIHQDDVVRSLFSFMRRDHLIPYDKLTKVVLENTIDRHDGVFCANPFNLPYLEIGMIVSEDAILKIVDIVKSRYRDMWFQEMKGLHVPNFHSDYRSKDRSPLFNVGPRSNHRSLGSVVSSTEQGRRRSSWRKP